MREKLFVRKCLVNSTSQCSINCSVLSAHGIFLQHICTSMVRVGGNSYSWFHPVSLSFFKSKGKNHNGRPILGRTASQTKIETKNVLCTLSQNYHHLFCFVLFCFFCYNYLEANCLKRTGQAVHGLLIKTYKF